jgi:hypothetical protein
LPPSSEICTASPTTLPTSSLGDRTPASEPPRQAQARDLQWILSPLHDWLFKLDLNLRYFNRPTVDEFMAYVANCLEGPALTWFRYWTTEHINKPNFSPELFRQHITTQFGDHLDQFKALSSLLSLRQHKYEHLTVFHERFLNTLLTLERRPAEEILVNTYLTALHYNQLARAIIQTDIPNHLEEAMARAEWYNLNSEHFASPTTNHTFFNSPKPAPPRPGPYTPTVPGRSPTTVATPPSAPRYPSTPYCTPAPSSSFCTPAPASAIKPAPMSVGHQQISAEECIHRGLCHYCKKEGHIPINCPVRPQHPAVAHVACK